ncbi:MAG TPA: DUF892 family protein [Ktedonobacteraceae bacterium]|nr:DUF892 family protein [Ktedonobacteraceae bacterium]
MAIQNPRDLFLYDLRAMYDVEQKLAQILPVLAQESMDNAAREAFLTHEQETRQHIRNLEQCFQAMGSQPATLESNAVAGLTKDHDAFLQQQPPVQALVLFDLHTAYQSECLEIAAYHNLIDTASSLGLQECVQLFQQNLQQEVSASQKLATIAHQYIQQQVQPAQNAVPAAPMPVPNPVNAATNPYAASSSQMPDQGQPYQAVPQMPAPNQSYATDNSPMSKQDGGTASSNAPADRASQVQENMRVVGSDMSNIGRVKQVRDDDFLVDIPVQRDLYVPFTAIQDVDADQVVLNIQGHQINDMNWAKPSLL